MKLKKIYIYGFKSFADKTEIEVKDGITAVIGPNGSGKSNIVDAIRWVLGEQSIKSLRGNKSQDIIFSGTQYRKSLGFAEVSIIFDNTDGEIPIDFDEIKVTRKLYRDGESGYYINGEQARLKTIQELFMDTGIGKDGYSIIGQGRIDEILSDNSEERRKVFEEATGIVKYRERRKESIKNIENTNQNLMRVNDIISEIEERIFDLEKRAEKAQKYIKLFDEKKKIEFKLFKETMTVLSDRKKEVSKEVKELEGIISEYRKQISEFEINKEKIEDEIEEIDKKAEKMYQDLGNINNSLQEKEKEIKIFEEKIKNNQENIRKNNQEILEIDSKLENIKIEKETREKKLEGFKNGKNDFVEKLKSLEKELEGYKNKNQNFVNLERELLEKITEKEEEIFEKDNEISEEELKYTKLKEKILTYEDIKRGYVKEKDNIAFEIEDKRKIFVKENNETLKKIEEKEKESSKFSKEKTELEEKEKEKNSILNNIHSLKTKLDILKELEKEKEGLSFSVKKILEEKEKNTYFGKKVDNILANIVSADEKYILALETALRIYYAKYNCRERRRCKRNY